MPRQYKKTKSKKTVPSGILVIRRRVSTLRKPTKQQKNRKLLETLRKRRLVLQSLLKYLLSGSKRTLVPARKNITRLKNTTLKAPTKKRASSPVRKRRVTAPVKKRASSPVRKRRVTAPAKKRASSPVRKRRVTAPAKKRASSPVRKRRVTAPAKKRASSPVRKRRVTAPSKKRASSPVRKRRVTAPSKKRVSSPARRRLSSRVRSRALNPRRMRGGSYYNASSMIGSPIATPGLRGGGNKVTKNITSKIVDNKKSNLRKKIINKK